MENSTFSELKNRVITGNEKMRLAWLRACQVLDTDPPEYERLMTLIDKSYFKLETLCLTLEAHGFEGCLYDTPRCKGADYWCYACPSKNPYWREVEAKQLVLAGGGEDG